MFSHNLLRRFVKDFSLPIQLVQEPYFEYYLDLYDRLFNTKKLFRLFVETVEQCGGEEQFFKLSDGLQEMVVQAISSTPEYQRFISDSFEKFSVSAGVGKGNLYIPENGGKYFVSFDLKNANYNALKYYSPAMVLNTASYEELIGRFTEFGYFKKAKHFRQVIFGNLNPKRQVRIQQYLIGRILEAVEAFFSKEKIRAVTNDEVVVEIDCPEKYFCNFDLINAVEQVKRELGIELNIGVFLLKQLKPYSYYVKEHCNAGKVEFKGVPSIYMSQVIKHYFKEKICEYDLYFYHEGQIARFIAPLVFE